jgi:tetratricopeptide (TPR) repeat protein
MKKIVVMGIVAGGLGLFGLLGSGTAAEKPVSELSVVDPSSSAIARADSLTRELEALQAQGSARADDPTYYFELGNVFAELSRREDAAAAFQAALDLKPEYVEALVNYGALQSERGEAEQAIQLLTKAVELRPKDARAHVNLGAAHYTKSEYYKAMTHFRKALEIDSNFYEAHYHLGVAFADAGIYREAMREWELVVKLGPGSQAAKAASENLDVVKTILQTKS